MAESNKVREKGPYLELGFSCSAVVVVAVSLTAGVGRTSKHPFLTGFPVPVGQGDLLDGAGQRVAIGTVFIGDHLLGWAGAVKPTSSEHWGSLSQIKRNMLIEILVQDTIIQSSYRDARTAVPWKVWRTLW